MIATVNASIANAPATTSAMAAASEVSAGRANPHCGRQDRRDEHSAMVWNERRHVVLLLHEYALGRAYQVRRLQRSRRQEGAVRTECRCSARRERAVRQDGAAARRSCVASSSQNCSGGVRAISTVVYPQQPCKQAKSARPGVWGEAPRFFFFFLFFIKFLKK